MDNSRHSDQDWHHFEKGKTIGKKGSEDGIILYDLENIHGARITVEQIDDPVPGFAITFGIYGLLFHTYFRQHQEEVDHSVAWLKSTMDKVFDMYEQSEGSRTDDWYHEHDRLVHELTID